MSSENDLNCAGAKRATQLFDLSHLLSLAMGLNENNLLPIFKKRRRKMYVE